MATAHKILRIVFAMLRDDRPYRDPQIDYEARTAIKNKARWLKMLRKANLLQEVAEQAAKQLRPAPDGVRAGPPPVATPELTPVGWLRCFRGIDTLTAVLLLAELHDVQRFPTARCICIKTGRPHLGNGSGDTTS